MRNRHIPEFYIRCIAGTYPYESFITKIRFTVTYPCQVENCMRSVIKLCLPPFIPKANAV